MKTDLSDINDMKQKYLTKDVGSILVGKQTVKEGIIDEIGGLKDAMKKLYELVDRESNK